MNNTKGKERRDNKSRRLCLLHKKDKEYLSKFAVVPHAGTWIEIYTPAYNTGIPSVVPHAGTWIEMVYYIEWVLAYLVVPHAGTWIEMLYVERNVSRKISRSPRGNVD